MTEWEFLSTNQIAGNSFLQIIVFFSIILLAMIAGKVTRIFFLKGAEILEKKEKNLSAVLYQALARSLFFGFFAIALKLGLDILSAKPEIKEFFNTFTDVIITVAAGYILYSLVDVVDRRMRDLAHKDKLSMNAMFANVAGKSIRLTIVVLAMFQIATILSDEPLTSVIASLGVGGLAVALAGQDAIKNFFGSLIIMADKPFQLGERIVVDGHDGPVESVGLRSTRVRTLDGHLVTIPNGELANKAIKNIGRRPYIRRLFNVTITYDTSPEKVERALDILKEILKDHEGMDPEFPPRIFFNDFNSDSLNILVIYWYHPPEYWAFLAFTEKVNKEILTKFNNEGIDFAFPTQTVYLAGDEKRKLRVEFPNDDLLDNETKLG